MDEFSIILIIALLWEIKNDFSENREIHFFYSTISKPDSVRNVEISSNYKKKMLHTKKKEKIYTELFAVFF